MAHPQRSILDDLLDEDYQEWEFYGTRETVPVSSEAAQSPAQEAPSQWSGVGRIREKEGVVELFLYRPEETVLWPHAQSA